MKKALSFLLALCLLLSLGACGNDQKAVYEEFANKKESSEAESQAAADEGDELSGELRIAVEQAVYEDMGLDLAAKEFCKLHPNVSIAFEAGMTQDEAMNSDSDTFARLRSNYAQRIATQLMGSDPPDIIETGNLGVRRYSESGLFCNFYDFPDWAETFPEDEYYMDVLTGAQTGKGLFALPTCFGVEAVKVNRDVAEALDIDLDAWDSATLEQLLELYGQAVEKGIVPEDFYFCEAYTKWEYCETELDSFLNPKAGEARFDSPEFIGFISRLQPARFKQPVATGTFFYDEEKTFAEGASLVLNTRLSHYNIFSYFDVLGDTGGVAVPYENRDGKLVAAAGNTLSIPVSSPNKELAWEFIKYIHTQMPEGGADNEYYNNRFQGSFPLNKALAEDSLKKRLGKLFDESHLEAMQAVMGREKAVKFTDIRLDDVLKDILVQYFDQGLISAEQCAQDLQERTEIYLNE